MSYIWFALWFFLPAGLANTFPVVAAKIPMLSRFNKPLDLGKYLNKRRIFGDNKTWRGLIFGIIIATVTVALQVWIFNNSAWIRGISNPINYSELSIIWLGPLLGLGALLGDAIESFFKRQLGINPGSSWFPLDQIDYIIGGCVLSLLVVRLPLVNYGAIVLVWFFLHIITVFVGHKIGVRDKPI